MNAIDLIDQVIDEGEWIYKHTAMEKIFFFFHVGQGKWLTPETQAYIKALGFEFRQMRIMHSTCAEVHALYKWELVGDSPELCRGPDAHGFADFDAAVSLNCSLASAEESGNMLREAWDMGDPERLFSFFAKAWVECAPTSERFIQDLMHMAELLDKAMEAKGCVVPDDFLRSGRRARRRDDKGMYTRRVTKRQRKTHPCGQTAPPRTGWVLGQAP